MPSKKIEPFKRDAFLHLVEPPACKLARRNASVGHTCNPWLDHGNYYPLLDKIVKRSDLTAGDKKFHAAWLRSNLTGSRETPETLATAIGISTQMVYRRMRKFLKLKLLYQKFGGFYLASEDQKEYKKMSRMPFELMASIPDSQAIVYARLCGIAGDKGWAHCTRSELARACGFCLKTLHEAVRGLKQRKLIRVDYQKRRTEGKHGGGRNTYRFLGHALFQSNLGVVKK